MSAFVFFCRTAVLFLCGALLSCSRPQEKAAAGQEPLGVIPLEPYLQAQTVVHAIVKGQPGTFLFDTGEGISSFSPAFAAKIGCKPWGRVTGFRMSGERLDNAHCDQVAFALAGQNFIAPVVITVDIMSFLGPDVPPVDGAIGLDLFAGRVITIVPKK